MERHVFSDLHMFVYYTYNHVPVQKLISTLQLYIMIIKM